MPTITFEKGDRFKATFKDKPVVGLVINSSSRFCLLVHGIGGRTGPHFSTGPIPPDAKPAETKELGYEVSLAFEAVSLVISKL